ncbi:MAG TPA: hypothetical protein VKV26_17945 [Dehalococcoidia bacterium]|nr:hypothetical protein [Dehalococcoidia bacterium]
MPEATTFQLTFDIQLVPADSDQAEVSGYINAGNVTVGGQQFGVFVRQVFVGGGPHGIAAQGIAAPGIAVQGIAAQGIAAQGIAAQGIARA